MRYDPAAERQEDGRLSSYASIVPASVQRAFPAGHPRKYLAMLTQPQVQHLRGVRSSDRPTTVLLVLEMDGLID